MDKIDLKILWNLDYNARLAMSVLAKRVGISKQNLHYRMKRLREDGIITGFMSVIDIHRLGYLTYRVYMRYKSVDQEKEEHILNYLKKHDHVLWLVSLSGSWDIEVVFTARNFVHFNNMFKKLKEDIGKYFARYDVSMSIFNYHFKRDYLLNKKRQTFAPFFYGFEPQSLALDDLDINILTELSTDCRRTNQAIGEKLGVTYHTIKSRIQSLESKKILQTHRIVINLNNMGKKYYKALITLNNPKKQQEKELYAFCASYNFVVYLVEVLGSWQLEVETEVTDQEIFIALLRELRCKFPDLILDYSILQLTHEHKLNYMPMGKLLKYVG